jgi:hypothetical protein
MEHLDWDHATDARWEQFIQDCYSRERVRDQLDALEIKRRTLLAELHQLGPAVTEAEHEERDEITRELSEVDAAIEQLEGVTA